MDQITGALVGVALVLSAVFVPVAFSGGSVGAIYRQFSLTIVAAMMLSVLTALILTPALCATLLKPIARIITSRRRVSSAGSTGRSTKSQDKYHSGVRARDQALGRWLIIYLVVIVAVGFLFVRLPKSFLPDEDQGTMFVLVQAPAGSTQERTAKVRCRRNQLAADGPEGHRRSGLYGERLQLRGPRPELGPRVRADEGLRQRQHADQKVGALVGRMFGHFAGYKDAMIFRSIRRPFRNWARHRASTSSCRIARVSVTRS
jgi:multidrug efflux pump